jgi:hypothetical protein
MSDWRLPAELVELHKGKPVDRESFFKKVDEQVGATHADLARQTQARFEMDEISRTVIAQVTPILETYAEELRRRKIEVTLDGGSFELHYAQGGYYGFSIEQGKLTEMFSEKGMQYHGAAQQLSKTIDLVKFEENVQKTIDEFMRRAPQHGGFLSQGME